MWGGPEQKQLPNGQQRPMLQGFGRAMGQQPMPQRPGAPAPMGPGQPASNGPPPSPAWGQGGPGRQWLQSGLQNLGQRLGAQSMPPAGAPQIINPGDARPGGPDRGGPQAPPIAQGAQQYAQNAQRALIDEEDPRLQGMRG